MGGVKTKRMLAAAATGCLRQHDAAHTKLRKTAGKAGQKATGAEEMARSLASRRRTAVGVRYVGAGFDDVMRDGVAHKDKWATNDVRLYTRGEDSKCATCRGTQELIKVKWRNKLHN